MISYKKHQTVTKLKKTYTDLAQTTNMAIKDYGPIQNWEVENEDGNGQTKKFVDKYIAPYLNVAKNCGYGTTGDCKFEWAYLATPNTPNTFDNKYYKLILNDGTGLYINTVSSSYTRDQNLYYSTYSVVTVDINGQKGPNVYGKDIFYFIYPVRYDESPSLVGRFQPDGLTIDRDILITKKCNKQKTTGKLCAAIIMKDGWQIKDDYPW